MRFECLADSNCGRAMGTSMLVTMCLLVSSVPGQSRPERVDSEPGTTELEIRRDRPYGVIGFASPGQMVPHWEFLRLLTVDELQVEIKLTDEQREELKPVLASLMKKQRDWSKARAQPELLKTEYTQAIEVLSNVQKRRVEQVMLQRRGVTMFLHEDVQKMLGMKPEQISKIRETWQAHVKRSRKGWKGTEGRDAYYNVWKIAFGTFSEKQRRQFRSLTGRVVMRRGADRQVVIAPAEGDATPIEFPAYEPGDEELDYRRDRPFGGLGFAGGTIGPNFQVLQLAVHRPVQIELDVSPEQAVQLGEIKEAFVKLNQEKGKQLRVDDSLLKDLRAKLNDVLTDEQSARIDQIIVQRKGVMAFMDRKIAERLKLTDEQLRLIRAAWADHAARARKGWKKPTDGRESAHNVFRIALKSLTAEQREEFRKLTGPIIRK